MKAESIKQNFFSAVQKESELSHLYNQLETIGILEGVLECIYMILDMVFQSKSKLIKDGKLIRTRLFKQLRKPHTFETKNRK